MGDKVERPGTKVFNNEAEAIAYAKDRVAEMWITHYYSITRTDGIVTGEWRVNWWCQ
jgi:hypothetical protein